jgi:hypothetical protein
MQITTNWNFVRKFANGQFEFKIGGLICRAIQTNGDMEFEVPPEVGAEFQKLIDELVQFQEKVHSIDLDFRDVHIFLRKYFRMQAEVAGELRRALMAQLQSQPDDIAKLPLEERPIRLSKQYLN